MHFQDSWSLVVLKATQKAHLRSIEVRIEAQLVSKVDFSYKRERFQKTHGAMPIPISLSLMKMVSPRCYMSGPMDQTAGRIRDHES